MSSLHTLLCLSILHTGMQFNEPTDNLEKGVFVCFFSPLHTVKSVLFGAQCFPKYILFSTKESHAGLEWYEGDRIHFWLNYDFKTSRNMKRKSDSLQYEFLFLLCLSSEPVAWFYLFFSSTANLVLHQTVERIHVGKKFGDIPRGIFVVRGENVVLLGEVVSTRDHCPATLGMVLWLCNVCKVCGVWWDISWG